MQVLDQFLVEVPLCPLCGSSRRDAESTAAPNLYSEQLALIIGCEEAELLATVRNRRCSECGLWYKPRWFRRDALHTLFSRHVPGHPKGWDAVSGRFSEAGFAEGIANFRHAIAEGSALDRARCRRSLASIVDSIVDMEGTPLQAELLGAIERGDIAALASLQQALQGRFEEPVAFKRFSGFSSPRLWEWMESHLGPVRRYGEVGCPLWGQLARPATQAGERIYFQRAEVNYWGDGCRRGGVHCSLRLAACADVALRPWPPPADTALDALGAFQYIDHLERPGDFVAEACRSAGALLLILDGLDAPIAIQHFSGWDERPLAWLAARHGKRVVGDFQLIQASGNRAWLLF